jgi:Bacterial mobilisation protein (MobC)
MGRPKKNPAQAKLRNIVFRAAADDVPVFRQRAALCGMNRSEYLRQMGLHGKIVVQTSDTTDPAILSALTRIGVNINQLVRKANATGTFLTARLADEIAALRPMIKCIVISPTEDAPDVPDNRQ